jgi:maltase-glucoamylase
MNEPANFEHGSVTGCSNSSYNYPPYLPKSSNAEDGAHIFDKTICMDAQQNWGLHYNVHNLYGHSMAMTTYNSLRSINTNLRPFLLLRSNFAGTQKYGAHWLGDNASQWPHLAWSIVGMLEFSLFGFSNTGADICGYFDNVTEQMCQRWMQLGAFYPFARNHNGAGYRDQDPAAFSADMIRSSRDILMTRYKLLPFLYTLLHEAHVYGNTVVRPLLHEFTSDKSTWSIDRQFLWGPSLMIAPVLEQDATIVNVYFPAGRWYDYYGGAVFESTGVYRDLSTPLDKIQLHIRGGYIIPWQTPDNTTEFSRRNPFGLIVALGSPPSYQAQGNLYWDDGISHESFEKSQYLLVNFKASGSGIEIEVVQNSTYAGASSLEFTTIDIWGLERRITNVNINGIAVQPANIEYYDATKNTRLTNVQLSITANAIIAWQIES